MRIAMISYWTCPLTRLGVLNAGGLNVYILNLANELGKLGHQVDIYTRAHKERDESIVTIHQNVRIIHLATRLLHHYQNVESFGHRIIDFTSKQSLSYEIIHSHYFYSGLVGLFLKEKLKIPHFVTFHTLAVMKDLYAGISDSKRIEAEKKIIEGSDGIIASTELEKNDLLTGYKASPSKIFVIHPGVNHHIFKKYDRAYSRKKLHLSARQKMILFVGRIDPIKGISLLIEAIYKLTHTYPKFEDNYRVILIGGDIESRSFWKHPEVVKISRLIDKKKLDCCIKFIGSRPHNILPFYYSASDVIVAPSSYESFGLVVLEAMACGGVVLASKVGGLKYLITDKDNGRLFESGNFKGLGSILWELLNDKKQRLRLGQAAEDSSYKFCWDKQANKTIDVYKKFL